MNIYPASLNGWVISHCVCSLLVWFCLTRTLLHVPHNPPEYVCKMRYMVNQSQRGPQRTDVQTDMRLCVHSYWDNYVEAIYSSVKTDGTGQWRECWVSKGCNKNGRLGQLGWTEGLLSDTHTHTHARTHAAILNCMLLGELKWHLEWSIKPG